MKTCKFCSEDCLRKNIRDQIIEGHLVGDTVEELLRERDLSLETAISKCRAQEAAKKQREEISPGVDSVQVHAVKQQQHPDRSSNQQQRYPDRNSNQQQRYPDRTSNQQQRYSDHTSNRSPRWCAGCGSAPYPGGRQTCPAFGRICHNCKIVGHLARVCRKPTYGTPRPPPYKGPGTMAVQFDQDVEEQFPQVNASRVGRIFEPAPTIQVHLTSLNGTVRPRCRSFQILVQMCR